MNWNARTLFHGIAAAAIAATACAWRISQAQELHSCDAIGERGWQTVATVETVKQTDSAPRQEGVAGEWFVERTTTRLPFCNYYNSVGNYSLRSYTLSPETRMARVAICRRDALGDSIAVAPYPGPCPPH